MTGPGTAPVAGYKNLLRAFLDFFFPPLCHACRSFIPGAGAIHLCNSCLAKMPPPGHPACSICGIPFSGPGGDHPCGTCLTNPPRYDLALAASVHEGPLRHLIHEYKYLRKVHLRRPLALLVAGRLGEAVRHRGADLVVPVPLHVRRLRSRGFNQAVLLGDVLARCWNLPLERRLLGRVRWTEPQVSLTPAQRRENVRGAFAVPAGAVLSGRRVVLVDDVLTTGSTVDECAAVLKRAGAAEVVVVTVTRAPAP